MKKRLPLKGNREKVYLFVLGFEVDYGVTPTLTEIADKFDWLNAKGEPMHQASAHHVDRLVKDKWLRKVKGMRNIRIIERKYGEM